jgi:hypothetical protein
MQKVKVKMQNDRAKFKNVVPGLSPLRHCEAAKSAEAIPVGLV